MKCPHCGYEPRDRLMSRPCPKCGDEWWDTEDYTREIAGKLRVDTVLDVGCGTKGIIAEAYWLERGIKQGYACDVHVLRAMQPIWRQLLCDVRELPDILGPESVDFITHCGLLEHCSYDVAIEVLHTVERLARAGVFSSCSAALREVDYKVKRDGNPYHYYKSWWDARSFELLGYTVDRARMRSRKTYGQEVMYWFYPGDLKEPWTVREEKLRAHLASRYCTAATLHFGETCGCEPVIWDPVTDTCACLRHYHLLQPLDAPIDEVLRPWLDRPETQKLFPFPPGREPRPLL